MRHENIYHTCDRCGKKLNKNSFFSDMLPMVSNTTLYKGEAIVKEERNYSVDFDNNPELEIRRVSAFEETKIELCNKCGRDFKKFMLNK